MALVLFYPLTHSFNKSFVGDNEQTAYGNGLALRRVNGQVRLFSTAYKADNFSLYEVSVPTLKTTPGLGNGDAAINTR